MTSGTLITMTPVDPKTAKDFALSSTAFNTSRISTPTRFSRLFGGEHVALATTITRSFAIREPIKDVATFYRWALTNGGTGGFLVSTIDFCAQHKLQLCDEARLVLNNPNAGGNSALSEALSFEVLKSQFGVRLDKTENEIAYWCLTKITDFSVFVGQQNRIGVSVTRACKFKGVFTVDDAMHLLRKKLFGINESTSHVITPHQWRRQVLHIWVQSDEIAKTLQLAFDDLSTDLRSDTLVLCTVAQNANWVFFGDQSKLPSM